MDKNNELSFEEALEGLEKSAEALKKEGTTLEEAMNSFENGIGYYKRCTELLKEARQKIQVYDKDRGELQDF